MHVVHLGLLFVVNGSGMMLERYTSETLMWGYLRVLCVLVLQILWGDKLINVEKHIINI